MNEDLERLCRACMRYFCCSKCRCKHETTSHEISEYCEICMYGRTILKSPSEELVQHIKKHHLPLHCLLCKIVFLTLEDCFYRHICTGQKPDSKDGFNKNYESPVTNVFHKSTFFSDNNLSTTSYDVHYLTSTPMQKNDNGEFKKIPEILTPVEYYTNKSEKKYTESIKWHGTPISHSQTNNIQLNVKYKSIEKNNIGHLKNETLSRNALICQDSNTVWESALTSVNFTHSNQEFNDTVTSPPLKDNTNLGLENSSVNELYLSSEYNKECDISSVAKKLKSASPRNSLGGKSKYKPQFLLEGVVEEPSSFIDENTYPNIYSSDTQTTETICQSNSTSTDNIWTTMSKAWKSAWKGLSHTGHEVKNLQEKAVKRPQSDDLDNAPDTKRLKIADIQCRKTIHVVPTLRYDTHTKKFITYHDKAVQTD